MPYIKSEDREYVKDNGPRTAGELNYVVTVALIANDHPEITKEDITGALFPMFQALIGNYITDKGLSYQTLNDIVGALIGARLEFQRRKDRSNLLCDELMQFLGDFYMNIVGPYEDRKIIDNGDVY